MNDIKELQRLAAPAPKPQALAFDGTTLWLGSLEQRRIYAVDPVTWTTGWETPSPGLCWGLTVMGPELRAICSETPDSTRNVWRCVPGTGFDAAPLFQCPDDMGSQLGYDGKRLHLSQWYPKKVLTLGAEGKVERVISVPHGICGQVIVDGIIYLVTTDAEETTEYWLTRVDPRPATPQIDDLVRIPFAARALAFDGKNFWTNHRAQNQTVCFARPD